MLSDIRADNRAQPRAELLTDRIGEYVEDMRRGDKFPPLVVFQDGEGVYWLADGFHRYHAAVGLGLEAIECIVHAGGLRETILHSCGANAAHGLRRTNADKRQAVTRMLKDGEWSHWSDREIARRCSVGHPFVAQLREQLKPVVDTGISSSMDRTFTHPKTGEPSIMRTGNIGRARMPRSGPEKPVPPPVTTQRIEKKIREAEKAHGSVPLSRIVASVLSGPLSDDELIELGNRPAPEWHVPARAKCSEFGIDWKPAAPDPAGPKPERQIIDRQTGKWRFETDQDREAARLKVECEQRTSFLQRALTVFNPRGCDPRAYAERIFSEIDLVLWPPGCDQDAPLESWRAMAETIAELVRVRTEREAA
jgi:hypothetical protein